MATQLQDLALLVWQQTALAWGFNLATVALLALAFWVAREPLPLTRFSLFAIWAATKLVPLRLALSGMLFKWLMVKMGLPLFWAAAASWAPFELVGALLLGFVARSRRATVALLAFVLISAAAIAVIDTAAWGGPEWLQVVITGLWQLIALSIVVVDVSMRRRRIRRLATDSCCLGCGHPIRVIGSKRCPECGLPLGAA